MWLLLKLESEVPDLIKEPLSMVAAKKMHAIAKAFENKLHVSSRKHNIASGYSFVYIGGGYNDIECT